MKPEDFHLHQDTIQRALFEHAVDGCYVVDTETDRFVDVNQAFCDLHGMKREELLKEDFTTITLLHPDDRMDIVGQGGATAQNEIAEMVFRAFRGNGEERWIEARTRFVCIDSRRLAIGSARDITEVRKEHKRLKEELRREAFELALSQSKAKSAEMTLDARTHMVQVLAAMPQLNQSLSEAATIHDLARRACLFVSNRNEGMRFDSCAIYVLRSGAIEVLYANPFLVRERYKLGELDTAYAACLQKKHNCFQTPEGGRVAAIQVGGEAFGILEVGVSHELDGILAADVDTQRTFENGIVSLAGMIGLQLTQMQLLEAIHKQVLEDELTGLFNRRHFTEVLATEFKRASRYERDLSLMVIDIDHFKRVNDTFGHAQGDVVLRRVAEILSANFRDVDAVCRIGGEEIAVLLPETPKRASILKADAIRDLIAKDPIPLSQSLTSSSEAISITISIGVAALSDRPGSSEELFQMADRALFEAKNTGRNRVCSA